MKTVAHKNGWFHQTVHIWLFTAAGQVLLQQRGDNKTVYPSLWDVSVAGHVVAGEAIETAALREVYEEIGLQITVNELQKIGVFKSVKNLPNAWQDKEFHHTFLAQLKVPIAHLKRQESEVEALKLMSLSDFSKAVIAKSSTLYVPHAKAYYKTVIQKISKRVARNYI